MRTTLYTAALLTISAMGRLHAEALGVEKIGFTVRDLVEMTRFDSSGVQFSPDSRHFFYIARRGNLDTDTTSYELNVYEVSSVERALAAPGAVQVEAPHSIIVNTDSSEFGSGIYRASWFGDDILIQGFNTAESRPHEKADFPEQRLYRVDSKRWQLVDLSAEPRDDLFAYTTLGHIESQATTVVYKKFYYRKAENPQFLPKETPYPGGLVDDPALYVLRRLGKV